MEQKMDEGHEWRLFSLFSKSDPITGPQRRADGARCHARLATKGTQSRKAKECVAGHLLLLHASDYQTVTGTSWTLFAL